MSAVMLLALTQIKLHSLSNRELKMKIVDKVNVQDYPITELYALLATDDKGNNGIIAMNTDGGGSMPIISSDTKFLCKMKFMGQILAEETGRDILMVKFSNREVLETIKP